MRGRFFGHQLTKLGRVGHPVAITRKMVRCAGVVFEDRWEGKKWTYRRYEAYPPDWPEMEVWTVQVLTMVNAKDRARGMAYGLMIPVPEAEVPPEVREHGMAELVKLRLKGAVRG